MVYCKCMENYVSFEQGNIQNLTTVSCYSLGLFSTIFRLSQLLRCFLHVRLQALINFLQFSSICWKKVWELNTRGTEQAERKEAEAILEIVVVISVDKRSFERRNIHAIQAGCEIQLTLTRMSKGILHFQLTFLNWQLLMHFVTIHSVTFIQGKNYF